MRIVTASDGAIQIVCDEWPGFSLPAMRPVVEVADRALALTKAASREAAGAATVDYDFSGVMHLRLQVFVLEDGGLRLKAQLRNVGARPAVLGRVALLEATADQGALAFGRRPDRVVMLVQSNYRADVVSLGAAPERVLESQDVWVAYDRDAGRARPTAGNSTGGQALLVGFETNERWSGTVVVATGAAGTVLRWAVRFDGGDLQMAPGQEVALEDVLLLQGPDPFVLLERYGDAVAGRHQPSLPSQTPVSWCSWYPYRLGVSEERVLATARVAAGRLRPLGLRIIEVDLGWERDYLPNAFEENAQFPHGLKWLSQQLAAMGFQLGCWKAPYQISEFAPMFAEHPEWLIAGEDGKPAALSIWFWPPHGKVYSLDLTHPGAQEWLRLQIRSLAERGIAYFKVDFIGQPGTKAARRRFNRGIAAGAETARIGARIIREELAEALILNCGGQEMPGTGQWPLLYACQDTGNTGVLPWEFQKTNFRAAACHLWKNRRWGVIQASCLCVGLPGTLEEARIRATVAFLSGGQIDISDTLTTLPEDRWAVLQATLPPLGISARAIDLFDPVFDSGSADYESQCRGEAQALVPRPQPPGSVWHLHVKRAWDEWDLVAVFALESDADKRSPTRFQIPLERLGLDERSKPARPPATAEAGRYWCSEFWSGQFLGQVPACRRNPGGYEHPGDLQDLTVGDAAGVLELAFTGPAVKLLCLRSVRPHPWVVGTSFHQSCGAELEDVAWNPEQGVLSGRLLRPPGHAGYLLVADAGRAVASAAVDGIAAPLIPAANGAWRLPVVTRHDCTSWRIEFAAHQRVQGMKS